MLKMELIRGNDIDIAVGDLTICYNDHGNSDVPIIFIHGFPFNKESWHNQMDFLKKTNRVIAYDIRGYGKSTSGNDEFSINLFADDLIHFMDGLQIPKAIICGLSMGGYIALNAVHRYPERVDGLILIDTQCSGDTTEGKQKRSDSIEKINKDGLKEYAENSVKNLFCKNTIENSPAIVKPIRQTILDTSKESITKTLSALANREDACYFLNSISLFTLILCGSEDAITPVAKSEALHAGIKNSSLKIIENSGHLSILENPNAVNAEILKFTTTTLARF